MTEGFDERIRAKDFTGFGEVGDFDQTTEILVDWCSGGFSLTIRSDDSTRDASEIKKTANSEDDLDLSANVIDLLRELTSQSPNLGVYYVDVEGTSF